MLQPSELIAQLRIDLEATTNAELVAALSDKGVKANETKISLWTRNKSGPRWADAVRMLAIVKWLSPEALAKAGTAGATEATEISGRAEKKARPQSGEGTATGDPP